MKRWFWINDRLAWPFVAAVVFATLVLLVTDLIWRVLVMPAEALAAMVIGVCIVAVLIFSGFRFLAERRKRPS